MLLLLFLLCVCVVRIVCISLYRYSLTFCMRHWIPFHHVSAVISAFFSFCISTSTKRQIKYISYPNTYCIWHWKCIFCSVRSTFLDAWIDLYWKISHRIKQLLHGSCYVHCTPVYTLYTQLRFQLVIWMIYVSIISMEVFIYIRMNIAISNCLQRPSISREIAICYWTFK